MFIQGPQRFLEYYAGHYDLARLGVRCLELNRISPKFLFICPQFVILTLLLKSPSVCVIPERHVATLPLDAAIKAHFCLEAWLSPTPKKMRYKHMCFRIGFDIDEVRQALKNDIKFLENLRGGVLNKHNFNDKAEELAIVLEKVIIVELIDFHISEKAVEMFCHSLRSQSVHRVVR
ncbi:hypothetical protein GYMLUDRAFT_62109 [Collybiopsis luxurians FD-317 M1]|uniref:Uncharacterized protein n=1 Tax=Collybiopsis luxurians FD-317 M1 TaxID=944289 RepID=A0A0D0AZU0_9AGAR|nr:hypothetical protein GYMLUDRAFT_62109 [Collybiopsis luxurians FD-317 M1]